MSTARGYPPGEVASLCPVRPDYFGTIGTVESGSAQASQPARPASHGPPSVACRLSGEYALVRVRSVTLEADCDAGQQLQPGEWREDDDVVADVSGRAVAVRPRV